jgi:hypothetical protein
MYDYYASLGNNSYCSVVVLRAQLCRPAVGDYHLTPLALTVLNVTALYCGAVQC